MDRSPTPPRLPHIHGTTRAAAGKKERALLRLRKNQEKETISAQRFCGTDGEHKGRGNGKKRRSSLSLEGICDRKDRRARGEKTWRLAVQAVLWKTSYTLRWLVNPAAALPPRARVLAGAEEKGGGVEDKRGERRRFRCFLPSFLVGLFFARELTARSKATICFVWVSSELSVGPLACAGGWCSSRISDSLT
jgi:hypothetical protein